MHFGYFNSLRSFCLSILPLKFSYAILSCYLFFAGLGGLIESGLIGERTNYYFVIKVL